MNKVSVYCKRGELAFWDRFLSFWDLEAIFCPLPEAPATETVIVSVEDAAQFPSWLGDFTAKGGRVLYCGHIPQNAGAPFQLL